MIQIYANLKQGSDEWKAARRGHVTASNISDVMAKGKTGESETRKKYRMKLLAERMTTESQDGYINAAMEWGTAQEPYARMAYEALNNVMVDTVGFWLHPSIKWLGVSPDGFVGADGLVEIKCPNTSTHLDWVLDNKVPTQHVKQIQCQLWVTERQWCDFVTYDPRLPTRNQLFVVRVDRDEKMIAIMQEETIKILDEVQTMYDNLKGNDNG
jgi:putative phage-type endonuclease